VPVFIYPGMKSGWNRKGVTFPILLVPYIGRTEKSRFEYPHLHIPSYDQYLVAGSINMIYEIRSYFPSFSCHYHHLHSVSRIHSSVFRNILLVIELFLKLVPSHSNLAIKTKYQSAQLNYLVLIKTYNIKVVGAN